VFGSLNTVDVVLDGEARDDFATSGLAWAGDTDGDGLDDLLVGAKTNDRGGTDSGVVYLITAAAPSRADLDDAAVTLFVGSAGDNAGRAVAGADLDTDGLADVIVGAPQNAVVGLYGGAVYVAAGGGATGIRDLADADVRLLAEANLDYAGTAVVNAGDVNGDGADDLVVGGTGVGPSGGGYLILGGSMPSGALRDAGVRFDGAFGDGAGSSLAAAGDVNRDGFDDVLFGAYNCATPAGDSGCAFLVLGSPTPGPRSLLDAEATLYGVTDGDDAGFALAGVGDMNVDGYDDVLIGAYRVDVGPFGQAGTAYLVFGGL
jgi:hypothetical protein